MAACGLYAIVALMCGAAAFQSIRNKQSAVRSAIWFSFGVLFIVLIAMRLLETEDALREIIREMSRQSKNYGDRRTLQEPVTAALIALFGVAAFAFVYHAARTTRSRRERAIIAALAGSSAMLVLIFLRLISLHFVDELLYGALKLNWVLDVGTSVLVGAAAAYYIRALRQPERTRERR